MLKDAFIHEAFAAGSDSSIPNLLMLFSWTSPTRIQVLPIINKPEKLNDSCVARISSLFHASLVRKLDFAV